LIKLEFKDISFFLAGDAFQTRCIHQYSNQDDITALFKIIQDADVSLMNLEIAIHSYEGWPIGEDKYDAYGQADPDVALDIRRMGFNMVSRANNHAMDYSVGGLEATNYHLEKVGLVHAGAGMNLAEARQPSYMETSQGNVSLISATTWELGLASHSRNDVKGRPGVNPMRFKPVYHVGQEDWERLKLIADKMGILPHDHEDGFDFPVRGQKFIPDEDTWRELIPNRYDLKGNIKAIKDAQRLSDWVIFSLHDHYKTVKAPEDYRDNEISPKAVEEFAHGVIDAGADVYVGHGPHILRGIEIYKGRPIFYSLGNFIFQSTLCYRQPSDLFEQWGLSPDDSTADLYEKREDPPSSFFKDPAYWESVIVELEFQDRELSEIKLIPIHLDYDHNKPLEEQRTTAGIPHRAYGERAVGILEKISRLSKLYQTEIEIREDCGYIKI